MVGSAGNAPAVSFQRCFMTAGLQTAGWITSHIDIGSGGGSCAHGGRAYEARLNLILPAIKLVESVGSAPTSTCLQSRCITCLPRPHENGRPPRCCPEQAEFWRLGCASWRPAYQEWCGCRESHPDVLLGKEPFCC